MAPRATQSAIRIDGLNELRRDLRKVEAGLPKEVAAVFGRAAEKVAGKVRAALPRRSGRAAGSVKAARAQKGAIVRAGGAKVPYYGPLDFGGYPKGRPFVPEGRYLYPVAEDEGPRAAGQIEDELKALIRKAGLG